MKSNKLPKLAEHEVAVGDLVKIVSGFAEGAVGIVTDHLGRLNKDYRTTYKVYVMFPHFTAPRQFNYYECAPASQSDKRRYFKQMLCKPTKLSNHGL